MISEIITAASAEITEALESAGLEVTVCHDSREAVSAVNAGGVAVMVPPPAITPTTFTHWEAEFELWLLVGTPDPLEASTRLSPVVEALVPTGVTSAQPDIFETGQQVLAGYRVTTRSTYQKET